MAKKRENREAEVGEEVAPETETDATEAIEAVADEKIEVSPKPAIRTLMTNSFKFVWSEGEQAYCVHPLDADAKLVMQRKKVKRGEPVAVCTDESVAALAASWQGKANAFAEIISRD